MKIFFVLKHRIGEFDCIWNLPRFDSANGALTLLAMISPFIASKREIICAISLCFSKDTTVRMASFRKMAYTLLFSVTWGQKTARIFDAEFLQFVGHFELKVEKIFSLKTDEARTIVRSCRKSNLISRTSQTQAIVVQNPLGSFAATWNQLWRVRVKIIKKWLRNRKDSDVLSHSSYRRSPAFRRAFFLSFSLFALWFSAKCVVCLWSMPVCSATRRDKWYCGAPYVLCRCSSSSIS